MESKITDADDLKQKFKEFEQNVKLPLHTNQYFQSFKRSCKEEKNRVKYLTYGIISSLDVINLKGVHRILRELYNQSINSHNDQIALIEIIKELSESYQNAYNLAVLGSFMQEAFAVIRENISLCQIEPLNKDKRDERGNFEAKKQAKKPFYDDIYKLEPIAKENIPTLKLWLQISVNFLKNSSVAEFTLQAKYLLFDYALSFLTKSKDAQEEFQLLFYSILEACFSHKNMCIAFLEDPELTYWFFKLIDGCRTKQDFHYTSRLLEKLAKSDKLPLTVGDMSIINSYVLNPMLKTIFPNERSSSEQKYLEEEQNIKEISKTSSLTLYIFTSKKNNLKSISKSLKSFHTDILLRFYIACVERKDHISSTYTALAILNLLKSNHYKLPPVASRLGVYLVTRLVKRDDFLLILTLRLLKYVTFSKIQKICIFTALLTSETPHPLEPSLSAIDESIFKKNSEESIENENFPFSEYNEEINKSNNKGGKGNKEKNEVIYERSFDEESFEFNQEDEMMKTHQNKKKQELYKMIKEFKGVNGHQDPIDPKIADKEFYFKKRKDKNGQSSLHMPKYLFMNELGECFSFIKDSDGVCPFCSNFQGLFATSDEEFKGYCLKELENSPIVFIQDHADLTMSIFQAVFEFTLEDPIAFLYSGVVPFCCQLLISSGIPTKYKFPLLLYLSHLIINFEDGVQALYGVSFILFAKDFLSKFMGAFELESFQRKKQTFKIIVPKNQEFFPLDNLSPSEINASKSDIKNCSLNIKEGSKINLSFEEIEVNSSENIIWNKERNCFIYENTIPDESVSMIMMDEQTDGMTDDGKYTKFFWQFHFLNHCLKVVHEMVQKAPTSLYKIIESQLEGFLENAREMVTIFYKYSEKLLPTHPFHEDTECWSQIKDIMFETSSTIEEIQYALISKFPKFANDFFKMIQDKPEMLQIHIKLIGRFPTLLGSVALLSSLSLYYSYETKVSNNIKQVEGNGQLYVELFGNLCKEFQRLEIGLSSVLNIKESNLEHVKKKNQRIITSTLEFSISVFSILNRLAIKKRIRIEKLDKKTMDAFFKSFNGVFNSIGKYYIEVVVINQTQSEEQTANLPILYSKFFLNTGVFLWTYSTSKLTTAPLLKSGLISFCFQSLEKLNLSQDAFFSFMVLCQHVIQNSLDLGSLVGHYTNFIQELTLFLNDSKPSRRLQFIPILKGLNSLLSRNFRDKDHLQDLKIFLQGILISNRNRNSDVSQIKQDEKDQFSKLIEQEYTRLNHTINKNVIFNIGKYNPNDYDKARASKQYHKPKIGQTERLELLRSEAKELLEHLEIPEVIKNLKVNPKKNFIEEAGLISKNTAKMVYTIEKKVEMIANKDKIKNNEDNLLSFSTLNPATSRANVSEKILLENYPKSVRYDDSMNVALASFNTTREFLGLPYRFGQKDITSFGNGKNELSTPFLPNNMKESYKSTEKFSSMMKFSPVLEQFEGPNYRSHGEKLINSHVLRQNAKNILNNIDTEYYKLLLSEREVKPKKIYKEKFFENYREAL